MTAQLASLVLRCAPLPFRSSWTIFIVDVEDIEEQKHTISYNKNRLDQHVLKPGKATAHRSNSITFKRFKEQDRTPPPKTGQRLPRLLLSECMRLQERRSIQKYTSRQIFNLILLKVDINAWVRRGTRWNQDSTRNTNRKCIASQKQKPLDLSSQSQECRATSRSHKS